MNRITLIKQRIRENNIDALLITDPSQIFYLVNFTGSSGILLILPDLVHFFTDHRYLDLCIRELDKEIQVNIIENSYLDTLAVKCNQLAIKKLAILENYSNYNTIIELQKRISSIKIYPVEQKIISLIYQKTEDEIIGLTHSLSIAEQGIEEIITKLDDIETELQFYREIQIQILRKNADEIAFSPIIAWEANSAYPHHQADETIIIGSGKLLIDVGAVYNGFYSDITRMVILGEPDNYLNKLYDIVKSAKNYAIESIRPGVKISDVVTKVMEYFTKKGVIKKFLHSLGHGIGRTIHEYPRLSVDNQMVFEEGYVVTVEPGIYIEGWGGIRIEDTVAVENHGATILNTLNDNPISLQVRTGRRQLVNE